MNLLMKKDNIKKIAIIILMFFCFNLIIPTYSSAGIGASLLSKPIATLCMHIIDGFNRGMSLAFALDSKAKDLQVDWEGTTQAIQDIFQDDEVGFLDKLLIRFTHNCHPGYFTL